MKLIVVFFLVLVSFSGFSQDLNARVQILSPQIQNTNKRTLEVLELAITEFLNNRKWSDAQLQAAERIDCNLVITVKEWDGSSSFKTEAQILSSRPIFGSAYNSTILTINDKNFDFNYSEGQALDFSDQNYINNLSSLLAFYAYTIVGLDADTFSKLGGTNYFNKAQTVLNNAQNTSFTGCNLSGANFKGATLDSVSFMKGKMIKANFEGADLSRVSLYRVDHTGTSFWNAKTQECSGLGW